MTRALRRARLELRSLVEGARTRAFAARLLLLALATLLTAMPWTEHLTNWDRFFRGGQDVEFGLLAIGVAFGLAVLLAQRCSLLPPLLLAGSHPRGTGPRETLASHGHARAAMARLPRTLLRI